MFAAPEVKPRFMDAAPQTSGETEKLDRSGFCSVDRSFSVISQSNEEDGPEEQQAIDGISQPLPKADDLTKIARRLSQSLDAESTGRESRSARLGKSDSSVQVTSGAETRSRRKKKRTNERAIAEREAIKGRKEKASTKRASVSGAPLNRVQMLSAIEQDRIYAESGPDSVRKYVSLRNPTLAFSSEDDDSAASSLSSM